MAGVGNPQQTDDGQRMTHRPLLLPTYSEYKPSRVRWLDEIPSHWNDLPLKRIATFRSGAGFPLQEQGQQDLELPFYKVSDMNLPGNEKTMKTENNSVSRSTAAKLSAYIFPQGTIIFPKVGGAMLTNKRRILERQSCIDNNLMGCMVTHADPNFVFFLLQNTDFALITKPGPLPAINARDVKNIRVPYPPVEEQAAIARYLTHKDNLIQRFLQGKRRMLDLLKQLRKSTIHYAVIHGLDWENTPKKPSGIPWLGDIPAHWQTPRLKYLCSRSGIYGANVPATEYQDTGIRFIRTTDITNEGILKDSGGVFLPKELVENYLLDDGDIIISRSGTVGRAFLYQSKLHGPCAHAGYLVRFVPGPHILPKYLFQFTQTQAFQGFLRSVVVQSTIENVNARKYRNAHIPLPPLEEQAAIAEYLDDRIAKIDAAIAGTSRLIDLMEQYRKSLIHELVTGARDVRKAAAAIPDDPAPSASTPAPSTP